MADAAAKVALAAEERAAPSCGAAWSGAEGGRVFCDDPPSPGSAAFTVPRRVPLPTTDALSPSSPAEEGAEPRAAQMRCACVPHTSDVGGVYPQCHPEARVCITSPPTAAA